jgi:hypothetical protein
MALRGGVCESRQYDSNELPPQEYVVRLPWEDVAATRAPETSDLTLTDRIGGEARACQSTACTGRGRQPTSPYLAVHTWECGR